MPEFLRIAITRPEFYPAEARDIAGLLADGFDYVHIRKPGAALEETLRLLDAIPAHLYPRLRLHDHFELAGAYPVAGVHLNRRNPKAPAGVVSVTRSCHTTSELRLPAPPGCSLEYQTLSPVFDSISKPGYRSGFDLDNLRTVIRGLRVVALGGVTPADFGRLRDAGFVGAAMLGAAWPRP